MSEQASAEVAVRERSYSASSSSGSNGGGDSRKMKSAVIEVSLHYQRNCHWFDGVVIPGPSRHTQAPPTNPLS